MNVSHSHIVAIRRDGVIEGHQLRFDGGGAGRSKYFSTGKYGSAEKARRAAVKEAQALGLPAAKLRGGSEQGRLLRSSVSGAAGIRFEWSPGSQGLVLRVLATWVDRQGRHRSTSYSVERNGLEGALDRAIEARTSWRAPKPDRAALLEKLRAAYQTA